MKLYGNLTNRIEENRNYSNQIEVGTDITMYYWSDRTCYYVTKVIDQKHIFVKRYEIVADREQEGGMGHQNWLYFKTVKECNDYLQKYGLGTDQEVFENSEEEWVFRYNHWYQASRYNLKSYHHALELARKDCSNPEDEDQVKRVARLYFQVSDEELEQILSGKEIVKYFRIKQGISFGVRDYYYDWEF